MAPTPRTRRFSTQAIVCRPRFLGAAERRICARPPRGGERIRCGKGADVVNHLRREGKVQRVDGTLPALHALSSLTELDLSRTRLSGTLAGDSLGSLRSLQRLQLDHTRLSGTLPTRLPERGTVAGFNLPKPPVSTY